MISMAGELGGCHTFLVALLVCTSDCPLMICVKKKKKEKSIGRWLMRWMTYDSIFRFPKSAPIYK